MGEPLLRGRCTCWVWGFCRGCGGWEELVFQPWCQQMFHLPGSALFLSCGSERYLPHYIMCGKYRCSAVWEDLGMSPQGHSLPESIPLS